MNDPIFVGVAVLAGVFLLASLILVFLLFKSGVVKDWISWLNTKFANRQFDAILIGLLGAATFIGSAIFAIVRNPGNWHPQSFGIGFGSMASGLGVLFKLRQRREDNDESR